MRRLAARVAGLGLLLNRWTPGEPARRRDRCSSSWGCCCWAYLICTFDAIYPFPSLRLFVLPVIPLVRLAYHEYRARPLQATVEVLLAVAAVTVAFMIPTRKGAWASPWIHGGGAAKWGC